MLPNIHLLGIQGSGKGTQCAFLEKRLGLTYVASGDLFRARTAFDDDFAAQLKKELKKGHLLPTSYLLRTVRDFLENNPIENGLLGDGVIRTEEENEELMAVWSTYNLDPPFLIHLDLDEETAVQRIKHRKEEQKDPAKRVHLLKYGGKLLKRTDDNPQAISQRFILFHRMTKPVIQYFEQKNRCLHIDARKRVEEIHADMVREILLIYPNLSHGSD